MVKLVPTYLQKLEHLSWLDSEQTSKPVVRSVKYLEAFGASVGARDFTKRRRRGR